jgi:hypothetical protein
MKARLFVILLTASIFSFCSSVEERVVSSLFQSYVSAQEALAADNFDGAKNAFSTLMVEADDDLKKVIVEAAEAEDIGAARGAFKWISEKIAKMDVPDGYVVAYCPHADEGKGANWVQKEGDIANPYFGSKMLRCGVIEEQAKY